VELARAIDRAGDCHGWRLAAFVFMPEHVHLIIQPTAEASKIDEFLFAVKRPFSYRVKQALAANGDPLLERPTIRQRPGVATFRFWQEGPGYDRNLTSEKSLLGAIDYIHANPVRRKLCTEAVQWRWSSARWYSSDGAPLDAALPRLTPLPAGFFHVGTRGTIS
jgi:putative transposase